MSYGDYSERQHQRTRRSFCFREESCWTRSLDGSSVDPNNVTEYVTRSWYEYPEGDQAAKHPFQGETNPKYSGPKPPYEFLKTDEKYSWLKVAALSG